MQIHTPFIVSVAKFSEKQLVSEGLSYFDKSEKDFRLSETKYKTTLGSYTNKKQLPDFDISVLENKILSNVKNYAQQVGYNFDNVELKLTKLWLNEMTAGTIHKPHCHYGSSFSGCFYVNVPKNSGVIEFLGPRMLSCQPVIPVKNYTPYNSSMWAFTVEEGDMLIWESNLYHSVPALNFEGSRRCIAFDVNLFED